MKVAFFSPSWPYGQNGIISYVRNIGQALHSRGVEVIVLTFKANGSLGFETVIPLKAPRRAVASRLLNRIQGRLFRSPQDKLLAVESIAAALESLKSRGLVDLLEIEETFGWCGPLVDRQIVPLVVRLHGPYFLNGVYETGGKELDAGRLRAECVGIMKADAVTSPSNQVLDATWDYYGVSREAQVIPNPVPIDDGAALWSEDSCDPNSILYVGRTDVRKGGDIAIRAFRELAMSRPGLKLHFVGPDRGFVDSLPGETANQYLTRVAPDVCAQIVMHGALLPADIARLRRSTGVTLVASRYENFPLVVLEALAAGSPLVATRVGGIPEIVSDGETGLLCDPEDLDDVVGKLGRLLDDRSLAARLGHAGHRDCARRFHPTVVAERTLNLYREVLQKAGPVDPGR